MDITEKNGQPSMEEILASIRRIIAEEPSGPPPGIEIAPKALALQRETAFDEPSDFDLPSIFRTPAPVPEKPALFGRLTDAIRGATSPALEPKSPRIESPRMGDELSAADHSDPTMGPGRNGQPPVQYPALSTLKTARPDHPTTDARPPETPPGGEPPRAAPPAPANTAPAGSAFTGWFARPAAPPPAAIQEEIKRVMTPFKDTRFKQMAHGEEDAASETHSAPAPQPPAAQPLVAQPPEQSRVDFTSIIPARMDVPGIPAVEEYRWPPQGTLPSETSFGTPPRPDHPAFPSEPPHYQPDPIAPMPQSPLAPGYYDPAIAGRLPAAPQDEQVVQFRREAPATTGQSPPTGTIEDTTAELLRPMLRAWLADNMPRMVEKALHIEVAESVRPGRKLPGQ